MARTYRRKAYGKRLLREQELWTRQMLAEGRTPFTYSAAWRVFTDAWGADTEKRAASIARHRRSIRRHVHDALATGREPIIANENSNWWCWDGASITYIEEDA